MDELATAAKADPAEFRLRYLKDQRAIDCPAGRDEARELAGAARAESATPAAAPVVKGRGISYLRYNNAITYVAAVAEVEVNKDTGEVRVTRVCASHDCGEMVNPDGVANQVEGGVLQTVSRTLMEEVDWDRNKVKSVDWASYPIMRSHPGAEGRGRADRPSRPGRLGRRRADGVRDPGGHRQRRVRCDRRARAHGPADTGAGEGGAGGGADAAGLGRGRLI